MEHLGNEKTEDFISLLMANHQRIYAFILTLIANTNDADDIMQETTTIMWRKYSDFQPGSNFVAWGISIAHKKIFEYRKKKASSRVMFNDKLVEIMSVESKDHSNQTKKKLDALDKCITKLPDEFRKLIQERYEYDCPIKDLAEKIGKSVFSVYRTLTKIHNQLILCMRRTLAAEEIR